MQSRVIFFPTQCGDTTSCIRLSLNLTENEEIVKSIKTTILNNNFKEFISDGNRRSTDLSHNKKKFNDRCLIVIHRFAVPIEIFVWPLKEPLKCDGWIHEEIQPSLNKCLIDMYTHLTF